MLELARRPCRKRRILPWIVLTPVLLAGALVLAALGYMRHVPYDIPADMRPPGYDEASPGLKLRYFGITGYELSDGRTTLLLDPTFTRPELFELIGGPLVEPTNAGAGVLPERADYILVNHAHYDHVIDVPAIAKRTGATVVGSPSTINFARARGVPETQLRRVERGQTLTLGSFEVYVGGSRHTDIAGLSEPMGGTISGSAGPLWFWQYTNDGCLTFHLRSGEQSVWFHPTSTFEPGELAGRRADTLILGVTGEKLTRGVLEQVLQEAQPRTLIPTHHDNFFQRRERGLALMFGLDLEALRALVREVDPALAWYVPGYDVPMNLPVNVTDRAER